MSVPDKIFRQEVRFMAAARLPGQLPNLSLGEIAFLGKSNVGKSSLINSICYRRDLARVSNTPGRTQQINLFTIADKFILADLPGYGFAQVPPALKRNWDKLVLHYLQTRDNLKLVNLLIDSRRGVKDHDKEVMRLLISNDIRFQIVLTKSDQVVNHESLIQEAYSTASRTAYPGISILCVSSRNKSGISDLRSSLLASL